MKEEGGNRKDFESGGSSPLHCLREPEGKTLLLKTWPSSDKGYDLVRNDQEASSLMTSSSSLQCCTSC